MALSDTDQRGYYGLLVKPTFEQAFKSAAKPLHIPLPDRSAKWEALSSHREYLLKLERAHNGYLSTLLDYQNKDGELPGMVANMGDSAAGADRSFPVMDAQARAQETLAVQEASSDAVNAETQRRAAIARSRTLQATHEHTSGNPVLAAQRGPTPWYAHIGLDSDEEGTEASTTMSQSQMPQAAGHPAPPEFQTYRALNEGQRPESDARSSKWKPGDDTSYETMRRNR